MKVGLATVVAHTHIDELLSQVRDLANRLADEAPRWDRVGSLHHVRDELEEIVRSLGATPYIVDGRRVTKPSGRAR